jgi:hypothetical protein
MIRKWLLAEIVSQLRCCFMFHSARLLAVVASASSHFSEQMTVTLAVRRIAPTVSPAVVGADP